MIKWQKFHFIGVKILVAAAVGNLILRFARMTSSQTAQACRIYLRYDQKISDIERFNNPQTTLYAPEWVSEGLRILGERMRGTEFEIYDSSSTIGSSKFQLSSPLTLLELQKTARNEQSNTSGRIELSNYHPALEDKLDEIISLKDLGRQTIIVGKDTTTHYGGFRMNLQDQPNVPVYVVDLAGLQFQQPYNSGRLVLITFGNTGKRTLDDLIFENVVGETKHTYEEASTKADQGDSRFIAVQSSLWRRKVYFDSYAYRKFVANDVLLTGRALVDTVEKHSPDDRLNFKFLKYGSGFFAHDFGHVVNELILSGVVDGLEILFRDDRVASVIKHLEFPFYEKDDDSMQRLQLLKDKYGVDNSFSQDDALKETKAGLITATTNCADSMAVIGNEMRYGSVDAAIAENLESKGNTFCPILNPEMQVKLIDIRQRLIEDQETSNVDR
ncbi:hypothetical protein Bhyg_11065 [Pseudolycoriella hygida]|uniref:Uncharacterized protein n=1 Tax=Pseudolycoriella hygida TaxID=35572 RepID=A0A9Q0MWF7_9DIPT|nr:hypothetical protein Bhyg_11065 [Pseudolycoriella hygida]